MSSEIMEYVSSEVYGVWFLIGAALVFWMQAGFAMCETGFSRAKNAGNILMKNLMDFCIGTVMFIFLGFGLFLGEDALFGLTGMPNMQIFTDYASFDWSDPELVNGENGRLARIAYHESINEMYAMMNAMRIDGKSIEEIARAVSSKRNEIRLASYADDPEGLAVAKARNMEKYGHENLRKSCHKR